MYLGHSSVQATYNGAEGNSTIALSEPVHRDGTLEGARRHPLSAHRRIR